MKRFIFVLMLPVLLGGCALVWMGAGAGLGIGGYKYFQGQLEIIYKGTTYERVYEVSKQALKQLDITLVKLEKDPIEAKLVAKRPDGEKVVIKIKNLPTGDVWVGIRVGLLGDRMASELIKVRIDRLLGVLGDTSVK